MDMIEVLNRYPAWKLHRYEQPFDEGRVTDIVYTCSLCDGKTWSREEYGATPELAFNRAEESLKQKNGGD